MSVRKVKAVVDDYDGNPIAEGETMVAFKQPGKRADWNVAERNFGVPFGEVWTKLTTEPTKDDANAPSESDATPAATADGKEDGKKDGK